MTSIRRAWWAALVLAAIAGCTEEPAPVVTQAPVDMPAPSSPAAPAPSPAVSTPDPATPPAGEIKATPTPDAPGGEATPKVDTPAVDAPKGDAPKAAAVTLTEDEVAEIKNLPAAEQPLALKQLVCPVSGENLGSMGKPVKVAAQGQSFFLCCTGCEKEVKSDPAAVLAKLKK